MSGLEYKREGPVDLGSSQLTTFRAQCPAGKQALGGGGRAASSSTYLVRSAPADAGSGWELTYYNASSPASRSKWPPSPVAAMINSTGGPPPRTSW